MYYFLLINWMKSIIIIDYYYLLANIISPIIIFILFIEMIDIVGLLEKLYIFGCDFGSLSFSTIPLDPFFFSSKRSTDFVILVNIFLLLCELVVSNESCYTFCVIKSFCCQFSYPYNLVSFAMTTKFLLSKILCK